MTNCVRRVCGDKINKKFLVEQRVKQQSAQFGPILMLYLRRYNIKASMMPCLLSLTRSHDYWMTTASSA
jgi:hypothetical protein